MTELVLNLKALSRRKVLMAIGVAISALVVIGLLKKAPARTQWVVTKQLFVDSNSSAIPDSSRLLDPLIPRAGVFANMMTSPTVIALIGKAAHIPADEISSAGPAGSGGVSPMLPATAPGGYSLVLSVPSTLQPLITITAQALTGAQAAALANGAGVGLANYVNGLATSQGVPSKHRIYIRQLGASAPSSMSSGIGKSMLVAIFFVCIIAWSVLVILGIRFRATWRRVGDGLVGPLMSVDDVAAATNEPGWDYGDARVPPRNGGQTRAATKRFGFRKRVVSGAEDHAGDAAADEVDLDLADLVESATGDRRDSDVGLPTNGYAASHVPGFSWDDEETVPVPCNNHDATSKTHVDDRPLSVDGGRATGGGNRGRNLDRL